MEITIHLGMHKTGSSFLQQHFFKEYKKESGYWSLREKSADFLKYLLYSGDSLWDVKKAQDIFYASLESADFSGNRLTFVEEMLCGDPYLNAFNRARNFSRLNCVFPNAKYVLFLREQESMTQTLYLQYIKLGGSCSWRQFLVNEQPPLLFHWCEYLCYVDYVRLIHDAVGGRRFKCMLYEQMLKDRTGFLGDLAQFIGFDMDDSLESVASKKSNKSLSPNAAKNLRQVNKLFQSYRQPFLLFPRRVQVVIRSLFLRLSSSKKNAIPCDVVSVFCSEAKKRNHELSVFVGSDVSKYGY